MKNSTQNGSKASKIPERFYNIGVETVCGNPDHCPIFIDQKTLPNIICHFL